MNENDLKDANIYNTELKSYTVFGINSLIDRSLRQKQFQNIAVVGEIFDFKKTASSGHTYFSLQDKKSETFPKKSSIRCALFKFQKRLSFAPKNGDEVIVFGSLNLYHPIGSYSLIVESMLPVGEGNLLKKLQEIRERLFQDGLLDPAKKKWLPALPKRLGIVTALSGAALQDILKQVQERYPHLSVLLAPAQVQGDQAAASLIEALQEISKPKWECDVIIIGRGGGGSEDLMAFNDENLARAIAACPVPVVSAVGHQIDHSISDDVADVVAATPTDGAKLSVPEVQLLAEQVNQKFYRLENKVLSYLEQSREKLKNIKQKSFFVEPRRLLENHYYHLDNVYVRLRENFRDIIEINRHRFLQIKDIHHLFEVFWQNKQKQFFIVQERLEAYSPLATLQRGFSLTYAHEKIIRNAQDLKEKDLLHIRFAQGSVKAKVTKVSNDES